jgi:hypothetical protein
MKSGTEEDVEGKAPVPSGGEKFHDQAGESSVVGESIDEYFTRASTSSSMKGKQPHSPHANRYSLSAGV